MLRPKRSLAIFVAAPAICVALLLSGGLGQAQDSGISQGSSIECPKSGEALASYLDQYEDAEVFDVAEACPEILKDAIVVDDSSLGPREVGSAEQTE